MNVNKKAQNMIKHQLDTFAKNESTFAALPNEFPNELQEKVKVLNYLHMLCEAAESITVYTKQINKREAKNDN